MRYLDTAADLAPAQLEGFFYIPHLEVRPDWQQQGIGQELLRRMLAKLRNIYMIDLVCDPALIPYYERFGFRPYNAMIVRNYDRQSCD